MRAVDLGLTVIPLINKIDLPAAEPDRVLQDVEDVIGLDCTGALAVSAKTGQGVETVLEQIIHSLPPPGGDEKRAIESAGSGFLVRQLSRCGFPDPDYGRFADFRPGTDHDDVYFPGLPG